MTSVIIVGHPARTKWISEQVQHLNVIGMVMDGQSRGARWGHQTALEMASMQKERVVIMEDDAIPVKGFALRADSWFKSHPDSLLSFYLGTGRPLEWQKPLDGLVTDAILHGEDHITLPQLIHAVCYSIPPKDIPRVLDGMVRPEADFAIGDAWGKPVIYPVESLVEHRDGPTLERHADGMPRIERRVARYLAAPLAYEA